MSAGAAERQSLSDLVRPVEAGAHVVAAAFIGEAAVFALADGAVVLSSPRETERVTAHPDGGILAAVGDGSALVTGGDDGRVVRIGDGGAPEEIANTGGTWIDAVAMGADGAIAWSAGKSVTARDPKGWQASLATPSAARGLAFSPKGFQLAVAHYNGVTLWFPRVATAPKELAWKGSHLDVTWSPDARFVVSSMQENALHGWRVADSAHMRMTGYPAKPRSLSWANDGKWLASSGADSAVLWPFQSKDGPMGKQPQELGVRNARIERVAFHPGAPVLAIGYVDGCILLVRLGDDTELLARAPEKGGKAVTALTWSRSGRQLAFGTADGAAGVLALQRL
jgi:WD40 repeat protein